MLSRKLSGAIRIKDWAGLAMAWAAWAGLGLWWLGLLVLDCAAWAGLRWLSWLGLAWAGLGWLGWLGLAGLAWDGFGLHSVWKS